MRFERRLLMDVSENYYSFCFVNTTHSITIGILLDGSDAKTNDSSSPESIAEVSYFAFDAERCFC